MRARWSLALAAVCALVLLGAAPASAADPVSLGSGYVQDDAAVLGSAEVEAAEARLDQLADETGLDLWVVFVDRFSNPADAETWANTTAEQNGLGTNQYLLAIAVDAGQFYLSGDLAGPLDETQLQNIEQQSVLPALRDDDFAGAIEGAADGITDAAGGGSGSADGSGGIDAGVIIAVVAGAAIVAVVIFFIVRSRRRRGASSVTARPAESTADLARRASAALVATDDALRTGEQELGFATAEFPETATADFTAALAASRAELDRAFALRQQLDDEVADTDEQVRAWHTEVLALCAQATGRLEEQSERFADLRRLGQDAPAAIERLTAARATAEAAVAPAAERLARLQTAYAASALVTVADNIEQAQLRLGFADEQLAAARAAVTAGEPGDAAVAVRAAEDAVAQAQGLAQAVLTLDEQLSAAAAQVPALTAELQRDIAASAALPDADGRLGSAVAAARAELDAVAAGATATDPIAALQRLQAADTALDAHLESARDAAARLARAQQLLGPALAQAQAQISAAEDFIAARRGAVGATARTRLSEASAAFGQALQEQSVDAERALQSAQRAAQLAAAATDSARGDVDAFAPRGGGGGSDMGAMLGGLLVGSLLGGGRGNSGFGGGFGGGRPRSGGFGGGFGGSGRSRSGGGSFGGGGRSRRGGGRF